MGLFRLMRDRGRHLHATLGRWRGVPATGESSEAPKPGRGVDPAVSERRSQAMRHFFPKLAIWINNRIHFSRMREIERYLAQATDLVDLEHRIAKIERGAQWH